MTEDLLILGELIAEQAAHMDAAEHRLLTNIREFDRREGWSSAASCAHWLSWRVGWTLGTARERVRVAKALGSLPHIDESLRLGKVSYCKVRAMTRVATPANEQVLLMDAELTSAAQLERICRKYRQLQRNVDGANPIDDDAERYLRRRDLDNGMVSIEAVCHPEEAALIWAAIERATKELYAARHAADTTRGVAVAHVSAEARTACDVGGDVSAETHTACDVVADVSAEARTARATVVDVSAETHTAWETVVDVSAETCVRASQIDGWVASSVAVGDDRPGADDARNESARDEDAGETAFDNENAGETAFDDEDAGCDHADDEYEADCAYFERFGVCLERQPETVSRARQSGSSSNSAESSAVPTMNAAAAAPRMSLTSKSAERHASQAQFNRLDGLLALMRKFAMGESSKTPVEIVVTVSADALANRAAPTEMIAFLDDDGCLSAEAARRMSCDAGIVALVEDEHGNPLSIGRRTRSIPSSIGRALRKRDKCCRFPGCTNRVYVDGHHVKHWALGGETALHNLVLLCARHHKFVHEYGYRVEMDAAGHPQFFDPQGRPAKDIPPRIFRDDLGWDHLVAANAGLDIEPHVCGWNGEPISYNDVCHTLYRLDAGLLTATDVM